MEALGEGAVGGKVGEGERGLLHLLIVQVSTRYHVFFPQFYSYLIPVPGKHLFVVSAERHPKSYLVYNSSIYVLNVDINNRKRRP